MSTRPANSARGMTLIEAAISVVIVAVLISMMVGTFGSLAKGRQSNMARNTATALATQLLSEITQNFYLDPAGFGVFGPESGEAGSSRALFDDVDDYHNWTASPPQMKDGTAISGLTNWTRTVTVEHVDPDTLAPCGAADRGVKRITVTVTDPRGIPTTVTALRAKAGACDRRSATQTTCVGWIGVELQIGGDSSTKAYSGTSVLSVVDAGGP